MRVKSDVLCEKISTLQRSLTIHHVDFTSFLSLSSQPVLLLDVSVVLGELVVSYPFQRGFVVFVHGCWLLSITHLGKEVAIGLNSERGFLRSDDLRLSGRVCRNRLQVAGPINRCAVDEDDPARR